MYHIRFGGITKCIIVALRIGIISYHMVSCGSLRFTPLLSMQIYAHLIRQSLMFINKFTFMERFQYKKIRVRVSAINS